MGIFCCCFREKVDENERTRILDEKCDPNEGLIILKLKLNKEELKNSFNNVLKLLN